MLRQFRHRYRKLCIVLAAAAALCLLSVTWAEDTHGSTPTPAHSGRPGASTPGGERAMTMREALRGARVAEEAPHDGYDRALFKLYQDTDADGCDARREVLIAEAVKRPRVGRGCWLEGGKWYSKYDGVTSTSPQDMQIDHVVALNEAWQSGANAWPKRKLVSYGSYLKDPKHLIAVTGESNSNKSDKDPAEWLPPRDAYLCRYIADWVQIKVHWKLTMDVKEKADLEALANARDGACGRTPVRV